jgi:hypothetical protein
MHDMIFSRHSVTSHTCSGVVPIRSTDNNSLVPHVSTVNYIHVTTVHGFDDHFKSGNNKEFSLSISLAVHAPYN